MMRRVGQALGVFLVGFAIHVAMSSSAQAAEPQPSVKPPDPGALFDKLDTEHKGMLSAAQIPADKRGLFERLLRLAGKPADGQLTRAEFVAQLKSITEPPAGAANSSDASGKTAGPEEKTPSAASGRKRVNPEKLFDRLDKHHTGKLSVADVPEPRQKLMKRLLRRAGKPESGSLTKAEFVKAVDELLEEGKKVGGGKTSGAAEQGESNTEGKAFDVDKLAARLMQRSTRPDGKLTKSDLPERLQERFEKIDANHDGLVDAAELRAWLTKVAARR